MRRVYLIIFLSFICLYSIAEDIHVISGSCVDNFTDEPVCGATVILMKTDSVVIDTVVTSTKGTWPDTGGVYRFLYSHKGKFIIKVTAVGYDSYYQNVSIKSKREEHVYVKPIRLNKSLTLLPEVSVAATKVKMVMHGDTIVYNADAFKLKEGSMLESLIKELPGTTINDQGQIFVNGRYVESLLVNGRDFFNGNPTLALRNLPAYTVKRIKVYDEDGMYSRMMRRDMGDRKYTMDVRLKREYSQGYMANAEAGAGTKGRYTLKGLGMASTEIDNTVAYASVNNLNQRFSSGSRGSWRQSSAAEGQRRYLSGGVSYRKDIDKSTRSHFSSSLAVDRETGDLTNNSNTQTFRNGHDLFSNSISHAAPENIFLSSGNTIQLAGSNATLLGDVRLKYSSGKKCQSASSRSFTDTGSLNQTASSFLGKNKSCSVDGEFQGGIKLISDMLEYYADVSYQKETIHNYSRYDLTYFNSSLDDDHRSKYLNAPNWAFSVKTNIGYLYHTKQFDIKPSYGYSFRRNNVRNDLYRLDRVLREDTAYALGYRPEAVLLRRALDGPNTYHYDESDNKHTFRLSLTWRNKFFGDRGSLSVNLPLAYSNRHINYFRVTDYSFNRQDVFFTPDLYLRITRKSYDVSFSAEYASRLPGMTDLVDYIDDSDPLNIWRGNPNLKKSRDFNLSASYSYYLKHGMFFFSVRWLDRSNALDYMSFIDGTTGVRESKPVNTDGNRALKNKAGFSFPVGKKMNVKFDHELSYYRNNDLIALDEKFLAMNNYIHNLVLSEKLTWNYKISGMVSLGCDFAYTLNNVYNKVNQNSDIRSADYETSFWINTMLPWNLNLSSDMTGLKRTGLQNSEYNRQKWVWNLQLSREIVKNLLSARLECNDILHQLTNITYRVDPKGRTEVSYNTLPRYMLLTLQFKINRQAKKQ